MNLTFLYILKQRLRGRSFLHEFYFKGKKTLDIGCGEGEFLNNDKKNITGIDLNKKVIARLKSEGYKVERGNVTELDFKDGEFEAIHCHNVIEHLEINDALKMLKEIGRVLQRDGILVLSSEVATKDFWNTFGHTKPYPPEAILKLLRKESRESFNGLQEMEYQTVFYWGQYYKNKMFYLISCFFAFHFLIFRREYFLVLKKLI